MQDSKEIQELALAFAKYIPILAGTDKLKGAVFFTAEVSAMSDEDVKNRVCSVTGTMDEIVYSDVNLSMERNDGVISFPAVGSTVMVAKMPDGETYIIGTSDVDRWLCYIDSNNKLEASSSGFVFNDGTLHGLVIVDDLVVKLNHLESKVNNILTAIGTTWIPVPNDGGAALKLLVGTTLALSTLAPLSTTTRSDLENTKIKQ